HLPYTTLFRSHPGRIAPPARAGRGRARIQGRGAWQRLDQRPGGVDIRDRDGVLSFHKDPMPQFEAALKLAEVPLGGMRTCLIDGREILICHTREGVFALDNICTHAHARLCEGRLRATRLVCPLHGASFDIRDGRVLGPPAEVPLATHQVRVTDGTVEVALSGPAPV